MYETTLGEDHSSVLLVLETYSTSARKAGQTELADQLAARLESLRSK
jgi:hypothetical protein